MKAPVFKDTPISEITLRKYEKPYDLKGRDLVRKLCLSLGLLQPGDSRDIIVDILYILLEGRAKGDLLSSEQVQSLTAQCRKNHGLTMHGIAGSNIRRQIKRLRDAQMLEKVRTKYRVTENAGLEEIFDEKILKYLLPATIGRVREYLHKVDESFKRQHTPQNISPQDSSVHKLIAQE